MPFSDNNIQKYSDNIQDYLLFEKHTKVFPRDVIKGENFYLFVIDVKDQKLIDPDNISNTKYSLRGLSAKLKTNALICVVFDDPIATIKSYLDDVYVLKVKVVYDNAYCIYVPDDHRGKAIGKGGYRIKALKALFKKYYNAHVMIKSISVSLSFFKSHDNNLNQDNQHLTIEEKTQMSNKDL
ncbi:MAG: hypothetical protein N3E37_02300 [Candidatus Micrarchaeota archaeon]|nr:hypothetical protein [Candidatus Micrarchaeota archaeon]